MKNIKNGKCSSLCSFFIYISLMTVNLIHAYPFDYSISSFYSPSHYNLGGLSSEGKRFSPIELQFKRGKVNDFPNERIRANDCRSIMTTDCRNYIKVFKCHKRKKKYLINILKTTIKTKSHSSSFFHFIGLQKHP